MFLAHMRVCGSCACLFPVKNGIGSPGLGVTDSWGPRVGVGSSGQPVVEYLSSEHKVSELNPLILSSQMASISLAWPPTFGSEDAFDLWDSPKAQASHWRLISPKPWNWRVFNLYHAQLPNKEKFKPVKGLSRWAYQVKQYTFLCILIKLMCARI